MTQFRGLIYSGGFDGNQLGLPIGDGNEWNTGLYFPYSQAPFGGAVTPGSNFPTPFVPYYGPGYHEPLDNPPLDPDVQVPIPQTSTALVPTVKPIRGTVTSVAQVTPSDPAASTATDLMTEALDWIKENPVASAAILSTAGALLIYAFTGKD